MLVISSQFIDKCVTRLINRLYELEVIADTTLDTFVPLVNDLNLKPNRAFLQITQKYCMANMSDFKETTSEKDVKFTPMQLTTTMLLMASGSL